MISSLIQYRSFPIVHAASKARSDPEVQVSESVPRLYRAARTPSRPKPRGSATLCGLPKDLTSVPVLLNDAEKSHRNGVERAVWHAVGSINVAWMLGPAASHHPFGVIDLILGEAVFARIVCLPIQAKLHLLRRANQRTSGCRAQKERHLVRLSSRGWSDGMEVGRLPCDFALEYIQ